MRIISCILIGIAVASIATAQEQAIRDSSDNWEDNQWEYILESAIQDDNNSIAADELTHLEDNPVNLNTASAEELHRIPALSNLLASRIMERRRHERFTSIDELLEVDGVTPELIAFIRKFLKVGCIKEEASVHGTFLSRTSMEIEERQGFVNGAYPGSPLKILNRLHVSIDRVQSPLLSAISDMEIGVLTKKDPGELGFTNFLTWFAGFSIPSLAAHCIIGDYQMEASEGLMFWRASAFGKGSDVITPLRKNGGGIHTHLSSDENSFFRGISASIGTSKMQVQMLYSNKGLHATLDSLGNISAFYKTGLFRTESEQRKRNSSKETLIGFRAVAYLIDGLRIGCTSYRSRFANPLLLLGNTYEGVSELWMRGIDVSFTTHNFDLFSEWGTDRENTLAGIAGVTYEPVSALAMTLVIRNYPPTFQSIHGNAFGESGQVQNENGVYVGVRGHPLLDFNFSMYYDQFEHDEPTSLVPAPSHGNDFLALVEYKCREQLELSFRYRRKDSPTAIYGPDLYGRTDKHVISSVQQNYRLNNDCMVSQSWQLSSRIEWVTLAYGDLQTAEKGLLISQSLKCNPVQSLSIQGRIAVFETDSYNSSIYEFEDEVPGAYSNPALYGRGLRWYLMLRHQPFSKMNLALKYAQTVKDGVKSIGSGLDEINGDCQSVISLQGEVRF
jgi:DNA uptake protein ComE-like DNA-binding protein